MGEMKNTENARKLKRIAKGKEKSKSDNQSLFPSNVQANILHNGADPRCRLCNTSTKTIGHLISGCTTLAQTESCWTIHKLENL